MPAQALHDSLGWERDGEFYVYNLSLSPSVGVERSDT